jgi:pyridoxal phosphate enzyme (YggS family)
MDPSVPHTEPVQLCPPGEPSRIAQRLKAVLETIEQTCQKVGRDPATVRLVVVTKSATLDQIRQVVELGQLDLGENHVQQLRRLWCQISEFWDEGRPDGIGQKIRWHMIGHLQRNKVRYLLPRITLIHSVDTLRLAECINNEAAKLGIKAKVLLQVNASEEPQKYGVPVAAATHLAELLMTLPNLQL